MANILLINSFYYPNIGGGAEVMVQIQAEEFLKRGHKVTILCTGKKTLPPYENNGITVYTIGLRNIYWPYRSKRKSIISRVIWHLLDSYNIMMKSAVNSMLVVLRPDFVYCHNLSGFSVAILDSLKKYSIPFAQVIHDQYWVCPSSDKFSNGKHCDSQCTSCKLFRLPHRRISKIAPVLIGVSDFIVQSYEQEGFFEGIPKHTVHNSRILNIDSAIKKQENSKLCFGFIGTISSSKGIEVLLESFVNSKTNSVLLIAGTGEEELLNELIIKYQSEAIKFIGYADSAKFYTQIDYLVIPSLWPDTFPTVAIESLYSGVPVIASRIGGLPEIVKHDINGLLFSPGEVKELSEIFNKIFNGYYNTKLWYDNSKKSVEEFSSISRMIEKYEDIRESVTNQQT
ncbi:glycosyltransferase [Emticicia sp. ODNR4P]|nr:glycosyltransferase [Emticicia sp. ODNR4P]